MKTTLIVILVMITSGCGTLIPNTLTPEFEHVSHTLQHAPFTKTPTEYGYNAVQLTADWKLPKGFNLSVSEGYILNKSQSYNNVPEVGGMVSTTHEVFTAKIGYAFNLK